MLGPGIGLAVVGTLVTAGVAGMASVWLFHMPVIEGLLLGSILASTDGAAVFSLLRGLRLRARLARTLEAEAGLNDPVAFLLVVGLIELIERPGFSAWDLLQLFVAELAVGVAVGLGVGWLAREALRRMPFAPHGVHLVGPLAALALSYGTAAALHGSGFLAAYLTGLLFGSTELPGSSSVKAFVEGLAALAEIGLFFALILIPLAIITWTISVRTVRAKMTEEFTSKGAAIANSLANSSVDLILNLLNVLHDGSSNGSTER